MTWSERNGHSCHVERIEREVSPTALANGTDVRLRIAGMGCPNCAARVHNALLLRRGVLAADIDLERGLAAVTIDASQVQPADLAATVRTAGEGTHHVYRAFLIAQPLS